MISMTAGAAAAVAKLAQPRVHRPSRRPSPRQSPKKREQPGTSAQDGADEPLRGGDGGLGELGEPGGRPGKLQRQRPGLKQARLLTLAWVLCTAMWVYMLYMWPGTNGGLLSSMAYVPTASLIALILVVEFWRNDLKEGDDGWLVHCEPGEPGAQEVDPGAPVTTSPVADYRELPPLLPNAVDYYKIVCEIGETQI